MLLGPSPARFGRMGDGVTAFLLSIALIGCAGWHGAAIVAGAGTVGAILNWWQMSRVARSEKVLGG